MSEDEIDRMYGIQRMAQGNAYALMICVSLALWGVIFWLASLFI